MADLDTLLATAPAIQGRGRKTNTRGPGLRRARQDRLESKFSTIDAMTPESGDVLLKYVYKGLETPSDRTAALFRWQAKLAEKFGVGSIVRVLSEPRTHTPPTARWRDPHPGRNGGVIIPPPA